MVSIIGNKVSTGRLGAPAASDGGIGDVLSVFAKQYLDPLSPELKRQTIALREAQAGKFARENQGTLDLAGLFSGGGPVDPGAATAAAILGGVDPKNLGGYNVYSTTQREGFQSPNALNAAMSVPGANYGNTYQGTREAEAAKIRIARDAEQGKRLVADDALEVIMVPGPNGELVPQNVRRRDAVSQQPNLDIGKAKGGLLQSGIAQPGGIASLPMAEQTVVGATPKEAEAVTATLADGSTVPAFQRADGYYHAQTGQKLPDNVVAVGKIVAPNAEGLTMRSPVMADLAKSRAAVDTASQAIDGVIERLSLPDAAAATGWIGTTSRFLNDVRSQTEATVKLLNPVATNVVQELQENPELGPRINKGVLDLSAMLGGQQRAIDSTVLRSQIQDLAYLVAKARDPSGRMSNQDVDRAIEIIGGSAADPKAGIAVLTDLKNRINSEHLIRERALQETYGSALRTPIRTAPSTGAPSAPAAPAATPAPGGAQRWERGPDGVPRLVQ